jgi:hypothetical protein
MKALYLLAAAGAVIAAPAFAQESSNNHDVTVKVQAETPAKCNIAADDQTVTLANYDLTRDDGRARGDVGATIGSALTGLNMKAWCTGGANGVVLTRTSLQKDGSPGGLTQSGFAQNIVYDVALKIDGLARSDRSDGLIEATDDGASGPTVGQFGPTGDGAALTFVSFGDASSATSVAGVGTLPRASYDTSPARLVAGAYTSIVTLTLTPGL